MEASVSHVIRNDMSHKRKMKQCLYNIFSKAYEFSNASRDARGEGTGQVKPVDCCWFLAEWGITTWNDDDDDEKGRYPFTCVPPP